MTLLTRRAGLIGGAGLILGGCEQLNESPSFRRVLASAEGLTHRAQRLILAPGQLAREFKPEDRSPVFRSNGTAHPNTEEYWGHLRTGFANWRLVVHGLVDHPLSLSLPEIRRLLGLLPRTEPATFDILRGTQPMTLSVTPREKGQVEGDSLALARWDLTAKSINQFDNPDLYFQRKEGVFIFGIKYPGNAQNSGLQRQDILLKVDDKAVNTLDEVKAVHEATLKTLADHPRLVLTVLRNGLMRQVVMDISRDYSKE